MANNAVSTPATTTANSKLIDPGIKKIWFDEYKQLKPKLDSVFKVNSMDEAYEEHVSYAGLGEVPEVAEGETYPEDAVLHTYNTTLTATKYGTLIPVTHELWDDQREKIAGKTKQSARALARKVEKEAASVYNNAFSTSYTSYGDGKPLCSTDHTRADGGSAESNAGSSGAPLTDSNLETAIVAMRDQLDDRGNLLDIVPNTLLVPPALEREAIVITKSDQKSGTSNNDVNAHNMSEYTGGKLNVVVWNYLGSAAGGSDTAWFLLDSSQMEIAWKWREKARIVKLSEAVGAKTDTWYWKARFRAAYGWTNWRGAWGSKGDGSSYSN